MTRKCKYAGKIAIWAYNDEELVCNYRISPGFYSFRSKTGMHNLTEHTLTWKPDNVIPEEVTANSV